MSLDDAPVVDLRPLMGAERRALLDLLTTLSGEEWERPSLATAWTVKGLALHILDDDLGWLSRGRDGDSSGRLGVEDHPQFIDALAEKNQRWIDAAHGLSRPVVIGLLDWAGTQMDSYYATVDLRGQGRVGWASDGPVPVWFDIAQDFTERWVHQMQMRETLGRVDNYRDQYLPMVLGTFIWAVPHQFRTPAPAGTTITIRLEGAGVWSLTSGPDTHWSLSEGSTDAPDATIAFGRDDGWRWFTGDHTNLTYDWSGPDHVREPLLQIRGILA